MLQALLLFGSETWVLTSVMSKKLEGVHMGLLQQVVGNKTHWLGGDSWQKVAAESVLQAAGKKSLKT